MTTFQERYPKCHQFEDIRDQLEAAVKNGPERTYSFCCFQCGAYYSHNSGAGGESYKACPSCGFVTVPL